MMNLRRVAATALVFLSLSQFSLQSTDDGLPPVLTINIADVEMQEHEDQRIKLGGSPVVTCVDTGDGDPIRAYIANVSPASGCGTNCLHLEPCSGKDNFCLWFLPSPNTVLVSSYTLTIGCTDDVEPVVTGIMTVTIVSNSPPVFDPNNPPQASKKINGLKVTHKSSSKPYKVVTNDADGDPVYYTMSTNPLTEYLDIEYSSGQIRAVQDLKLLCEPQVQGSVSARDPYNSAAGPFIIDLELDGYNPRPTITNLDTTVRVDENIGVGKSVLKFDVVDPKVNDLTYNQRSLTSPGMDAYGMKFNTLRTLIDPNYEREDTRSLKLYFNVDDGYCRSETYSLTVEINDVPEPPVLSATAMLIETYEGEINEPPNVFVFDDDLNEVHTYNEESGTDDEFDVDPLNGHIIGNVELKRFTRYKTFTVKMRVSDKDGEESGKYEAKVRVFDSNNHPPHFTHTSNPVLISALDCSPPGSILNVMRGDDDDTRYNQNDWIYFGGGGAKFTVVPSGHVVLTQMCTDGETGSGTATITDMGIFPGPLSGDDIELAFSCGPCPPGGLPADGDDDDDDDSDDDDTTTDPSASNSTSNETVVADAPQLPESQSTDDILIWFVPTIFGGVIWLALTGLLLYKFMPPCKNPFSSPPKPVRVTPEPPKPPPPKRPPPPPPKPDTPPPPPPPPPPSDPYLFGFWKETYTDQDHLTNNPARADKPTAIERMPGNYAQPPPANLRLGPPGSEANMPNFLSGNARGAPSAMGIGGSAAPSPPAPAPKTKPCTIL